MYLNKQIFVNAAIGWLLLVGGFAVHHELQGAPWAMSLAQLPFTSWLLFRLQPPRVMWGLMLGFLVFTAAETWLMDFVWPDRSRWVDLLEMYLLLLAFGLFAYWMIRRRVIGLAERQLELIYYEIQMKSDTQ